MKRLSDEIWKISIDGVKDYGLPEASIELNDVKRTEIGVEVLMDVAFFFFAKVSFVNLIR